MTVHAALLFMVPTQHKTQERQRELQLKVAFRNTGSEYSHLQDCRHHISWTLLHFLLTRHLIQLAHVWALKEEDNDPQQASAATPLALIQNHQVQLPVGKEHQPKKSYISMRLQRKLPNNAKKVSIVSLPAKPKQSKTRMSDIITLCPSKSIRNHHGQW
jgi:hypothetical protein